MMTAHTMEEYTQIAETVAGVRKTLAAILALGPADAPVPGPLTSDGLKINELPPEYLPVGLLTPEGIAAAKEVNFSDVEALGHFAPAVRAGADAVLAASVFHFGELTIGEVKGALAADGLPVR